MSLRLYGLLSLPVADIVVMVNQNHRGGPSVPAWINGSCGSRKC